VIAVALGSIAIGAAMLGLMSVLAAIPPGKYLVKVLCLAMGSMALGYAGFRAVRYGFATKPAVPAK
jgi:hypothetical protein